MTLAVASVLTAAELMRAVERDYIRDAIGQFADVPGVGDDAPLSAKLKGGAADAADKLKLAKRAPAGFSVRSSKKLKTDSADVGVAEVDGPDGPEFRVGLITAESGKWDGGFAGEDRKAKLRQEIAQKRALLDSDEEQSDSLEDEINDLETELDDIGDRTAVLSPEAMASFRRQLDDALVLAQENKVKQDATAKELDALEDKKRALAAKFSDPDLEKRISSATGKMRSHQQSIKRLENDPDVDGWGPEVIAELIESHKADVARYEAELRPLLARRADLMPPAELARLEDLDRQYVALTDEDIDDMLTAVEISAPNGTRVRAEVWGSDDIDEQWTSARLYVLAPGETRDDADNSDGYASFRGMRGLNKLIAGLDTTSQAGGRSMESFAVMSASPAVQLMLWARTLEAPDSFLRKGKRISVERGKGGRFARKGLGDIADAVADAVTDDKPAAPKARAPRNAVAKALASGDPNALDGMSREALRREAKSRGLEPPRGVSEEVLRDMLWDDERSGSGGDAAAPLGGGDREDLPTGRQEKASSDFGRMRDANRAAIQADRDAALAKRRQADRPDAAARPVPKRTDVAARKAEIDAIIANPKPEDRERLKAIFSGMRIEDLKRVAADNKTSLIGTRKADMVQQLVEGTIGFRLNSQAILYGDWGKA